MARTPGFIAIATVPGTTVAIRIYLVKLDNASRGYAVDVERTVRSRPTTARTFTTEAEAREHANWLWTFECQLRDARKG
jgi:hypothetical protein